LRRWCVWNHHEIGTSAVKTASKMCISPGPWNAQKCSTEIPPQRLRLRFLRTVIWSMLAPFSVAREAPTRSPEARSSSSGAAQVETSAELAALSAV
jgi:hypothetical protein